MAKIEFYNVKKRKKVKVDEKDCRKVIYRKETSKGIQERYAVRGVDAGTNLTKFVGKADFDKLSCPIADK